MNIGVVKGIDYPHRPFGINRWGRVGLMRATLIYCKWFTLVIVSNEKWV